MPWSRKILHFSEALWDQESIENYFYPLYLQILIESFHEPEYVIWPQYPLRVADQPHEGAINFAVTYEVQPSDKDSFIDRDDYSPVMFIEVKPPTHLHSIAGRESAALQIKERFEELAEQTQIPKVYGVSAIGKNFACYCYDATSRTTTPAINKNLRSIIDDVAPIDRWSANIMEPEGRNTFLQVVGEVKEMAQRLRT
jgi:hypothetical protein